MKGKRITSKANPIELMISTLAMYKDALVGKDLSGRATALRDTIGDIIVDTCCPSDTGIWETGVYREKWIIVSQYETEGEAATGHQGWLALLKSDPQIALKDINMWNIPDED